MTLRDHGPTSCSLVNILWYYATTKYAAQFTIYLFSVHLALPSASCSSALTVRGREQLYLCYEGYHCFAFFQDFEVDCRAVLRAGENLARILRIHKSGARFPNLKTFTL